jgi:hypothetical protein
MLSRQFHHLESELVQIVQSCAEAGARCTVMFDLAALATDHRVIAAKLAKRTGTNGLALRGLDAAAAAFFSGRLGGLPLKAFIPAATLDQILGLRQAGCAAFVVGQPDLALNEWRQRLAAEKTASAAS